MKFPSLGPKLSPQNLPVVMIRKPRYPTYCPRGRAPPPSVSYLSQTLHDLPKAMKVFSGLAQVSQMPVWIRRLLFMTVPIA